MSLRHSCRQQRRPCRQPCAPRTSSTLLLAACRCSSARARAQQLASALSIRRCGPAPVRRAGAQAPGGRSDEQRAASSGRLLRLLPPPRAAARARALPLACWRAAAQARHQQDGVRW